MTCPDCEYNKARAANWRAEAYRLGGHDYIPRLWVGLTDEECEALWEQNRASTTPHDDFARAIEAKLKQKNGHAVEKNT